MNIDELMDEIVSLDTEVGIFKLYLMKTDHTTGFSAFVSFREWGQNIGNIETHGETAIEALTKLRNGLLAKFMSRDYYMTRGEQ